MQDIKNTNVNQSFVLTSHSSISENITDSCLMKETPTRLGFMLCFAVLQRERKHRHKGTFHPLHAPYKIRAVMYVCLCARVASENKALYYSL